MSENSITIKKKLFTTKELVLTAMLAAVIAVCAWISIPATVEFTLQVFGVFCALEIRQKRLFCHSRLHTPRNCRTSGFCSFYRRFKRDHGYYRRIYCRISFHRPCLLGCRSLYRQAHCGKDRVNAHWSCNMLRFRNHLVYVCFYQNQWSRYTHAGPEMVRFPLYTV